MRWDSTRIQEWRPGRIRDSKNRLEKLGSASQLKVKTLCFAQNSRGGFGFHSDGQQHGAEVC